MTLTSSIGRWRTFRRTSLHHSEGDATLGGGAPLGQRWRRKPRSHCHQPAHSVGGAVVQVQPEPAVLAKAKDGRRRTGGGERDGDEAVPEELGVAPVLDHAKGLA